MKNTIADNAMEMNLRVTGIELNAFQFGVIETTTKNKHLQIIFVEISGHQFGVQLWSDSILRLQNKKQYFRMKNAVK